MNSEATALIEKLAEKLGTTAEHLWGILLHQAPISGTIDLTIVVGMVLTAIGLVRFVRSKTAIPAKTENNQYPSAEWRNEDAGAAWFVTTAYLLITAAVTAILAHGIVTAFFNPEFWALSYILNKL